MKYLILIIILSSTLIGSSQIPNALIRNTQNFSPFKKDSSTVTCRRDWMMPESRMDSLKKEIKNLERQLSLMSQDSIISDTTTFILLYSTEHSKRIEADGRVSEQFCATDSSFNRNVTFNGKAVMPLFKNTIKSYENKYLVNSNTHYYLGNCRIYTTINEYYIRKDLYAKMTIMKQY